MASCHNHSRNTDNIRAAFFLNLGFTLLEIVGGLFTNSIAILSDALHDLGDSLSLGLAWWLEEYSEKEPSGRFTYGYRRFSLLGSLINAVVLLCGSIFILIETVSRLFSPEETHAVGMIGLAIVGIVVNGIAVSRLSTGKSENVKVLFWHLMEDVLGWVAVLFGGIVIYLTDLHIIDPLLSIGITAFILWNVLKRLNSTVSLFLQAAPTDVEFEDVIERLRNIRGVLDEHHTHVWSLDGEHHVLSTHITVEPNTSKDQVTAIKESIRGLAKNYGIVHVTVEIECQEGDCSTP